MRTRSSRPCKPVVGGWVQDSSQGDYKKSRSNDPTLAPAFKTGIVITENVASRRRRLTGSAVAPRRVVIST